jgi:hypothetical protein
VGSRDRPPAIPRSGHIGLRLLKYDPVGDRGEVRRGSPPGQIGGVVVGVAPSGHDREYRQADQASHRNGELGNGMEPQHQEDAKGYADDDRRDQAPYSLQDLSFKVRQLRRF